MIKSAFIRDSSFIFKFFLLLKAQLLKKNQNGKYSKQFDFSLLFLVQFVTIEQLSGYTISLMNQILLETKSLLEPLYKSKSEGAKYKIQTIQIMQAQTTKDVVFVTVLQDDVHESSLKKLFQEAGPLKAMLILRKEGHTCAKIKFQTTKGAAIAIQRLNRKMFDGKPIRVVEANDPLVRPSKPNDNYQDFNGHSGKQERGHGFQRSNDRGFGSGRGMSIEGERPKGCFKCGQEGHMARDCTNPDQRNNQGVERPKGCFNCREQGHIARDCPKPDRRNQGGERPKGCFKCGQQGHMARDCTNPDQRNQGRQGGERPKGCFKCGEEGHMARDCTNPNQLPRRTVTCYNCQEEGHMNSTCTNPRKERQRGDFEDRGPRREPPKRDYDSRPQTNYRKPESKPVVQEDIDY